MINLIAKKYVYALMLVGFLIAPSAGLAGACDGWARGASAILNATGDSCNEGYQTLCALLQANNCQNFFCVATECL